MKPVANSFCFEFDFQKGDSLNQCLEMLLGSLDYLEENIREGSEWKKELGMIGIYDFLATQNAKQQLLALNFLEKVVPRLADAGKFFALFKLEQPKLDQN